MVDPRVTLAILFGFHFTTSTRQRTRRSVRAAASNCLVLFAAPTRYRCRTVNGVFGRRRSLSLTCCGAVLGQDEIGHDALAVTRTAGQWRRDSTTKNARHTVHGYYTPVDRLVDTQMCMTIKAITMVADGSYVRTSSSYCRVCVQTASNKTTKTLR